MHLRSSSTPVTETSFSCNSSSPNSHSASGFPEFNQESESLSLEGIRRVLSDGNLKGGLVYSFCDMEEFRNSVAPLKSSYTHDHNSMLETAPSFNIFNKASEFRDEMIRRQDSKQEPLERSITIGDSIDVTGLGGFSFEKKMRLIEEKGEEEVEVEVEVEGLKAIRTLRVDEEVRRPASPPMYLATGLGVGGAGFGCDAWDNDLSMENVDENGNPEEYFKRMVDEYPCHPLFLRKYGQALEAKGDFDGAEEFYFRATLANPSDGEALCQYAELVWQLRHDQDKALSYFERAVQASPHDSNVLAAYASFLWEIEDDSEDDEACRDEIEMQDVTGDSVPDTAAAGSRSDNPEENYKMMIEENPNNALLLRNYAQFLWQSKGDLQGAEEHYLRAILTDLGDGEIMAQYATLVWELHHDSKKALSYFERAVQANPEDSYILAAYANFLWEHEEDEEDSVTQAHVQVPPVQGGAVSVGNA